jgi:alkylation response protein AidB-like acyl-CoA dehydrogenase
MEFRLDEAQVDLQETVARFCSNWFPLDAVSARERAPIDPRAWRELADLGVLGMLRPEETGGIGLTTVDAAIVFEQIGSHLVPGPVLWTLLSAPLVEGAGTGERRVGGVEAGEIVDGSVVIEHAGEIDVLLVIGDDGVFAHVTEDLAPSTPLDPLDPLTTFGRVTGLGPGEQIGSPAEAEQLRTLGTLLTAAMAAGISTRSLDVARAYALERHQFGAPIGSFQAVKHMLADMYVRSVSAQSAVYAASAVLHEPGDDDSVRAVAGAKLLATDAAILNAGSAIQVLGGMGFTWDMLPNYLLKRAWVLENDFGAIEEHALLLGSALSSTSA